MRSDGAGRRGLAVTVGALAAMLAAAPAGALPMASVDAPTAAVVRVQFLGGPFFGPHGYYHPNPADRYYIYEGFDPSLYPPEARPPGLAARHPHLYVHRGRVRYRKLRY